MDPFFGLSPSQRQAVSHLGGPLLVVSGPGSGKTRVLTTRLAYLIEEGYAAPNEMLAVTFTRKAAAELKHRLKTLVGHKKAEEIHVGTFHSVAATLCPPGSAVLGEGDRAALCRLAAEETGVSLSTLRASLTLYKADPSMAFQSQEMGRAILRYEELKEGLRCIDLDDLLIQAHSALVQGQVKPAFRYLSVDEYQDVSAVQRQLLQALCGPEQNLFAIGDPDQAIYSFRGADVAHFLSFETDFPGAQVVTLLENYRSTPAIVGAATAVIIKNQTRRAGCAVAARPSRKQDAPLCFLGGKDGAKSETHEATLIAMEIERLLCGTSLYSLDAGRAQSGPRDSFGYAFCDVAVLTRTGARADALAEVIAASGLPTQRPRRSLFDKDEALDFCAYLRLAEGAQGGLPPGVLLRILHREAPEVATRFAASLKHGATPEALPESVWQRLLQRGLALQALPALARITAISEIFPIPQEVLDVARSKVMQKGEGALATLSDPSLDLAYEADELDLRAERISVLSCHGAKGLEFPVVFVAGCEAGHFPREGLSPAELEEERRLFYVALTRAKERLYVSYSRGGAGGRERRPSPLLLELPDTALYAPPQPVPKRIRKDKGQIKLFR